MSRNGNVFSRWDALKREIVASVRCRSAVLDGEIACLDPDGRSNFYALLFGRRAPFYCAFDLLLLDGQDLRGLPLLERKRRLLAVMPSIESRVRYVDHVHETGIRFFDLACERDLEGVVGKFPGWVKFKNPTYSQVEGRAELFETRRGRIEGRVRRAAAPRLVMA